MKARDIFRRTQVSIIRLIAVVCLGIFTTRANAADFGQCMRLYSLSLGVPGTPYCALDTAATSPTNLGPDDPFNGMNYYNCYNNGDWL
jgi:hypothetical protein